MKQTPIKLGPLALLLAVISICLTTLAILTFTTARADLRLAEKYADTVTTRYALEAEGQAFLAEVSRDGFPGPADEDGVFRAALERDGTTLRIGLTADGKIVSWRQDKEWTQETVIGDLWAGF